MYLKKTRSVVISAMLIILLISENIYCDRVSWTRGFSMPTVKWSIDYGSLVVGWFNSYSDINALRQDIWTNIRNTLSTFSSYTGITFVYDETGTTDLIYNFSSMGGKAGNCSFGTPKRVSFDSDCHFYINTNSKDGSSFYFSRVIGHETCAVIVRSDASVTIWQDSYSIMNDCIKGEEDIKFSQADRDSMRNAYFRTVSFKNEFGNETFNNSTMYIDGQLKTIPSSGLTRTWAGTHTCEAADQKQGNYFRLFDI